MDKLFLMAVVLLAVLGSGCAPEPKMRILWPPPPSQPRLEFVGVYSDQYDFEKDRMGALVQTVAGEGAAASFKSPYGIVSDGKGRVYISDMHWRNIRVYDFNTKHVDFVFKKSPLDKPVGMTRDSKDRLYVVDAKKQQVFVLGSDRRLLYALGANGELFVRPAYVAINEQLGRLYVSDGGANDIKAFDLQGQHLFTIGGAGSGEGFFYGPQGMAVDDQGRLFVCDQFNAQIQVLDQDGNFLYQFGQRGDLHHQFESPKDVAFDSEGNLYVVDGRRPHIMVYSPDGELLLVAGADRPSKKALGFAAPRSIYIDDKDRIYITDLLNRRFSVWQYLSEAYLSEHPITEEEKSRLQQELRKGAETKESGE